MSAGASPAAAAGPVPDGAHRVAAIDCGTNSLRLLVADVDSRRRTLADLVRRMEIVRLGQGVDATGRLAPDALDRTFGVLAEYAKIITASSVGAVRMVATSATRDAANAAEFSAGVTRILGTAPEVLTGGQEAALSFLGAIAELALPAADAGQAVAGGRAANGTSGAGPAHIEAPYLVVDIGGGSTEFVLGGSAGGALSSGGVDSEGLAGGGPAGGGPARDLAACSVDIGCVRLTERYLHSDPPTSAEIAAASADIDAAVGRATAAVDAERARSLVGLAGSVTTVAGIALGLPAYDPARIHHARIPAGQVHEVTTMLLGMTSAQRLGIGVMHPGRADVIGAGALVLDRILTLLGMAEVVVSEHDILDGIAWSLVDGRAG